MEKLGAICTFPLMEGTGLTPACRLSLGDRLKNMFPRDIPVVSLGPRPHGFLLVCSGGHFNPAVSLAVTLIGGLKTVLLIPYLISQLLGGLIGAALAKVSDPRGTGLVAWY